MTQLKVVITGAAGKLGKVTTRALAVLPELEVRATDRNLDPTSPVPLQVTNLLERECAFPVVEGADVVVHLANHPNMGWRDPQQVLCENTTMNFHLFQAAAEVGVKKIVFASSIQTLGRTDRDGEEYGKSTLAYLPGDGQLPSNPANAYGLSKKLSEEMLDFFARKYGIQTIAIRFPYLAWDDHPAWWSESLELGDPNELGSYLFLSDAAALIGAVVKAPLPGHRIYLPAASENRTKLPAQEVVRRYYSHLPLRVPLEQMTGLVDLSGIEKETGWRPLKVAE